MITPVSDYFKEIGCENNLDEETNIKSLIESHKRLRQWSREYHDRLQNTPIWRRKLIYKLWGKK